jgi:hypothetical protein
MGAKAGHPRLCACPAQAEFALQPVDAALVGTEGATAELFTGGGNSLLQGAGAVQCNIRRFISTFCHCFLRMS